MPGKRLTIDDIARLAGVSKATVSRVLNRKPDVDPTTRERILGLMEELGFVPSAAATSLAGGRSRLIGMVVRSYTWPFVLEIMRAVADIIDQTPYELVLYRMNDRLAEHDGSQAINRLLTTNLTAGLLAIFPGRTSAHLAPLSQQGLPLVVIDDKYLLTETPWDGIPLPWITADNHTGAYEAVRHLIGHGHQRIAHIQGSMTSLCSRERYAGYRQALAEAGLPLDPTLVLEGDLSTSSGYAIACALFSLPSEQQPDAIFAANDQMAYGVLAAASEYNIHIPRDVALIGFDDLAEKTTDLIQLVQVYPQLTTVRQPFGDMGRYAIELLLSFLEMQHTFSAQPRGWQTSLNSVSPFARVQKEMGGVIHLQLPVKLMVRTTCGCVPSLPPTHIKPFMLEEKEMS